MKCLEYTFSYQNLPDKEGIELKLTCSTKMGHFGSLLWLGSLQQEGVRALHPLLLLAIAAEPEQRAGLPLSQLLSSPFRGGPRQGKVRSRTLNGRVYVAAQNRWPVFFPLCLHKAFHGHSCPFCNFCAFATQ